MRERIELGPFAGHHFWGEGDLQVAQHATRGRQRGYKMVRKRLVDRAAFNYDSRLGWEVDVWFEWLNEFEPIGYGKD
jgi:hypothetical protein